MCGGAFVCIVLYEEEGDRTKKDSPEGLLNELFGWF